MSGSEACPSPTARVDLGNNAAHVQRHKLEDGANGHFDERIAFNIKYGPFCAMAVASGNPAARCGSIFIIGSFLRKVGQRPHPRQPVPERPHDARRHGAYGALPCRRRGVGLLGCLATRVA